MKQIFKALTSIPFPKIIFTSMTNYNLKFLIVENSQI